MLVIIWGYKPKAWKARENGNKARDIMWWGQLVYWGKYRASQEGIQRNWIWSNLKEWEKKTLIWLAFSISHFFIFQYLSQCGQGFWNASFGLSAMSQVMISCILRCGIYPNLWKNRINWPMGPEDNKKGAVIGILLKNDVRIYCYNTFCFAQ